MTKLAMPRLTVVPTPAAPAYAEQLNPQFARRVPEVMEKLRILTGELRDPLEEVALLASELQDYLQFEVDKATHRATRDAAPDASAPEALSTFRTTMDRVDPAEVRVILVQLEQLTRDLETNYAAPLAALKKSN